MKYIHVYNVTPSLPPRLNALTEMAYNVWFSWHYEAVNLFQRLDSKLWEEVRHNPVLLLGRLEQDRINELLKDESFLNHTDRVYSNFQRYISDKKPYHFKHEKGGDIKIAYFSAEYGLADCLPIYSGGLGILSGDHLKSASDLKIPLVGLGLLYQQGYFRQYLNPDGWQQERYPENDLYNMPVTLLKDHNDKPLTIEVPMADHMVKVRVWRIQVGRIPLIMLDTNTTENRLEDRDITSQLYGGDNVTRLKQEIVLGIGGIRALKALGIKSNVFHMNEGHSAFACTERIKMLMEDFDLSFDEAKEAVIINNIFTTHTPVPAGHDTFTRELIEEYFESYLSSAGISIDQFWALGTVNPANMNEPFGMTILALKTSGYCNGVSLLHKKVSQKLWHSVWPTIPIDDVPIDRITNGIHIPSWISNDMASLYDRYLGNDWTEDPDNVKIWQKVDNIPDVELWGAHERRRRRLVAFARKCLQEQLINRGAPASEVAIANEILNPEALTIAFARRFAPYKRADMLFNDLERLAKLLNNQDKPVQLIFAGKAHPKHMDGKKLIQKIIHYMSQPRFRNKMVFIEDYDINVARYLLQGADVWLNNPRRPQEACGTSGMKAAANGVLNMSILDGWWDEGYAIDRGWAIGSGEEYEDENYQDNVEAQALYSLLEKDVTPLFYDRGLDNVPRKWVAKIKTALKTLCAEFNTHRMLEDYFNKAYYPAYVKSSLISENKMNGVKQLTAWKEAMKQEWDKISINRIETENQDNLVVGGSFHVKVYINLNKIEPKDVSIDLYYGPLDSKAYFLSSDVITLIQYKAAKNGDYVYTGNIPCTKTGKFGFQVRILPKHELLTDSYALGLILWG